MLSLLTGALSAAPASADPVGANPAAPKVSLQTKTPVPMHLDGSGQARADLVIDLDGLSAADLTPWILGVARGGQISRDVSTVPFKAKWGEKWGRGYPLIITADTKALDSIERHGIYSLAIRLTPTASSTVPTVDLPRIDLEYPTTKLTAAGPVALRATVWPWVSREPAVFSLRLKEGPIPDDLTVTSEPHVGPGRLEFTHQRSASRAGVEVTAKIVSDFELGTQQGVAAVHIPNGDDVFVPWTVKTTHWTGLIPVTAFLGLMIGFLIRIVWTKKIDRGRRKLKFLELRKRVRAAKASHVDGELAKALDALQTDVDAAIASPDVQSEPDNRLSTFQQQLDAAVAAAKARALRLKSQQDELALIAEREWGLAEPFRTPLLDARRALKASRDLLATADFDGAAEAFARAHEAAQRISGAHATWKETMKDVLREVARAEIVPPLPVECENTKQELSGLLARMDQAVPSADPGKPPGPAAYLQIARQRRGEASGLLAELSLDVRNAYSALTHRLQDRVDTSALDAAIEALIALDPLTLIDQPKEAEAGRVLHTQLKAVTQAMTALFGNDPDEEVAVALRAGRYQDAAVAWLEPRRSPTTAADRLGPTAGYLSEAEMAGPPPPVPVATWAAAPAPVMARQIVPLPDPAPNTFLFVGGGPGPLDRLDHEVAQTWSSIVLAEIIQFFTIALIFSALAYFVWAPTFVGFARDFFSVFMWGFTTDIAVSALLTSAKQANLRP